MEEIKNIRFGCLVKKGRAEVHEMPLAEVKDNQVLVKQLECNICTADYTQWLGLREHNGYPVSGGHEASGIVIKKGRDVVDLEVGDFVAIANNYCGSCEFCRSGRESECKVRASYDEHGIYKGRMGFADYFVRPVTSVIKMNKDLTPGEAAFLEPVATALKGINKLRLKPFEKVVVIGAGTMGMINAMTVRAYGGEVIVSEMMENKLETAKKAGFTTVDPTKDDAVKKVMEFTDNKGADCVIAAVGNTNANIQAAKMLKKMDGRLLVFAANYPPPQIGITANDIHYRRMEIIGTYLADLKEFLEASKLLNIHKIDVKPLIEKNKYYLDDINEAFKEASSPGKYRVSVLLHKD